MKVQSKLLVSIMIFLAPAVWAAVISMAVGQVRDHVVTSREVQINQVLEQLLYPEKKTKEIKVIRDTDGPAFAKQVTAVLLEWVVHLEADQVAVSRATAEEIAKAQAQIKKELKNHAGWKKLKATPAELDSILRRKIQAKKFIRFRADSSVVPISDQEARRHYEQNRLKFGDLPFESARSSIRAFLARQQVENRLKDWFEVLRGKYQVRNFLAEL